MGRKQLTESGRMLNLSCSYRDPICVLNVKSVHWRKFILHNRLQHLSKFTSAAIWPSKEARINSVGLHFNKYINSVERQIYLIQEVFGVIPEHDGSET